MKCSRSVAACGLSALLFSGCTLLNRDDISPRPSDPELALLSTAPSGSAEAALDPEPKVANPPAKTIRFHGREIVLGTTEVRDIATEPFCAELLALLEQEKYFTASLMINKNAGVAEQAAWERYTGSPSDRLTPFIADVLSRETSPAISWDGLLANPGFQLGDGQLYRQARAKFLDKLKTEEPSDQEAEQLRIVAQRLDHPLLTVDRLRLLALRELVAGRYGWAESLCLQAAEVAEQHGDLARAADLWMMAATTANRTERSAQAQDAWLKAVESQLEWQLGVSPPLNVHFWTRADEQRPDGVAWPAKTSRALWRFGAPVGCKISPESPAGFVLWCAIAATQYENAEPQLALVSFKKAESLTSGDDVMWLRIAQSKCLAALGQTHAAAALLSGPAASEQVAIAMASTAAIGSAKLHAGAYQQGIQLINQALNDSAAPDWPTRSHAEADLALAQLIVGDTDQGLKALHSAQSQFQSRRDYVSLLQSLENERRILELEGRTKEAKNVQQQVCELEKACVGSARFASGTAPAQTLHPQLLH